MACDQVSKGSFDTASNARVGATTTATTTTTTCTSTTFTATDSAITPLLAWARLIGPSWVGKF